MATHRTLDGLAVRGRRVLVRADLNVPVRDGRITDLTRIERLSPTIRELADGRRAGDRVQSFRPPEGQARGAHVAGPDGGGAGAGAGQAGALRRGQHRPRRPRRRRDALADGEVLLLENTRYHPGEEENDPALAREFAALAEVFVHDAFSAAHRAHASTEGVGRLLPAHAGRLMQAELEALDAALGNPAAPGLRRSSAAPRCPPSWSCWATW